METIITPDDIRRLNMKDALALCGTLDADTCGDIIGSCDASDHRVLFPLKLFSDWIIPLEHPEIGMNRRGIPKAAGF
jgi:hypothetical protein